jgi:hypothetical protein
LREALGWVRTPVSLSVFLGEWLPLSVDNYNLKLFIFAIVVSSIWTTRNKMTIEVVFPRSPTNIFFKIQAGLHKWRARLGEVDRKQMDEWTTQVKRWAEDFLKKVREHYNEGF